MSSPVVNAMFTLYFSCYILFWKILEKDNYFSLMQFTNVLDEPEHEILEFHATSDGPGEHVHPHSLGSHTQNH